MTGTSAPGAKLGDFIEVHHYVIGAYPESFRAMLTYGPEAYDDDLGGPPERWGFTARSDNPEDAGGFWHGPAVYEDGIWTVADGGYSEAEPADMPEGWTDA